MRTVANFVPVSKKLHNPPDNDVAATASVATVASAVAIEADLSLSLICTISDLAWALDSFRILLTSLLATPPLSLLFSCTNTSDANVFDVSFADADITVEASDEVREDALEDAAVDLDAAGDAVVDAASDAVAYPASDAVADTAVDLDAVGDAVADAAFEAVADAAFDAVADAAVDPDAVVDAGAALNASVDAALAAVGDSVTDADAVRLDLATTDGAA